MTKDEIEKLKAVRQFTHPDVLLLESALPRLLEERERLLEALKYAFDIESGFNHDVSEVAYAAIDFATAPAGKEEK